MTKEEAIKIVRENMHLSCDEGHIFEALKTLVPELAESEDEKFRNRIIGYLKQDIEEHPERKERIDEMLAYLEKQKEQKPVTIVRIPKFRVGDIIQHIPLEKWDRTKKITSIDEHGYIYNLSHLSDTVSGGAIGFAFEDEYELVEQKPAEWSEEDEKALNSVLSSTKTVLTESNREWLKSLPERFNLQPKQGWSEEEKGILLGCISALQNSSHWLLADKLSSLRPQLHWRPSEEQMRAVFDASERNDKLGSVLRNLYNDLKKL